MTRAEYRRTQRDKQKTYTLTKADIDRIRKEEYARASKELEKNNRAAVKEVFKMILAIPTNVLISDFWQKSAKKKIPEFVDSCISLYDAWESGAVHVEEMVAYTEELSGTKLVLPGTMMDNSIKKGKVN